MKRGQIRVRLRPCHGGAFTQVQLCGCVPTAVPARLARHLAALLTSWSGWPVALALCVDDSMGAWWDTWADILQDVPGRHLEIRFELPRTRTRAEQGERA